MLSLRPLPAFDDNYIWVLSNGSGQAVVVDPGEPGPVLRAAADGLQPVAILLTHHHHDHVGGAAELLTRFRIPCYAPDDARLGFDVERVGEGDTVSVAALDAEFCVMAIPGHTRSHIAFHGEGLVFCGDTLFSLGCGRMFEGSPSQMLASLDRLADLPGETRVCCGHEYTAANGRFAQTVERGNADLAQRVDEVASLRAGDKPSLPSTIAVEADTNPFLRVDQPAILDCLAKRGLRASNRVEAFASLRSWKDTFI